MFGEMVGVGGGGYFLEGRISYHKQIIMYVSNAQMTMMPGANERPSDPKILCTCSFLLLADLGAIFQFIRHSVQVFVPLSSIILS